MIQELKTSIDILLRALNLRSELTQRKLKRELVLDLLTAYYCFCRCVENADDLLSISGEESVKHILEMPEELRLTYTSEIYSVLLTQRLLLRKLSNLIYGQQIIEMLAPKLRYQILRDVRGKTRLALLASEMLQMSFLIDPRLLKNEIETYGEGNLARKYGLLYLRSFMDILDVKEAQHNLESLKKAGEELRLKINELCSIEEIVELSKKAEEIVSELLPQSNNSFNRSAR